MNKFKSGNLILYGTSEYPFYIINLEGLNYIGVSPADIDCRILYCDCITTDRTSNLVEYGDPIYE